LDNKNSLQMVPTANGLNQTKLASTILFVPCSKSSSHKTLFSWNWCTF
jgi:hypothetical protein